MTLIHSDCVEAMAGMDPESVDAIVTDPPYGLEFMGKEWDRLGGDGWRAGGFGKPGIGARPTAWTAHGDTANASCRTCGGRMRGARKCDCAEPDWHVKGEAVGKRNAGAEQQAFHARWAEAAYRVARPSAYLLAFGGTRTVHRMTCALEDAGWIIRDMLVWGYASGFPKSRASLKPAWEPIVMARKPGPLRMLAIDACRIGFADDVDRAENAGKVSKSPTGVTGLYGVPGVATHNAAGRWPANIVLTDAIFDGGIAGVVGGGETAAGVAVRRNGQEPGDHVYGLGSVGRHEIGASDFGYGDGGTYSRFFILPKADRTDREPTVSSHPFRGGAYQDPLLCWVCESFEEAPAHTRPDGRANVHPTVKPTDLMRHLVRLVTPTGGTVLDPFLGSGTTAIAAELEGFPWIGIEREAEYVAIAEARLNGTQRGLGLGA